MNAISQVLRNYAKPLSIAASVAFTAQGLFACKKSFSRISPFETKELLKRMPFVAGILGVFMGGLLVGAGRWLGEGQKIRHLPHPGVAILLISAGLIDSKVNRDSDVTALLFSAWAGYQLSTVIGPVNFKIWQ